MQQYITELTTEIINSCAQSPLTSVERATFDKITPQAALNPITLLAISPVKLMFRMATVGSLARNGRALQQASGKSAAGSLHVVRTGDNVVYADGSEATTISGTGVARVLQEASAALAGSMLDYGDEIISTPQSATRLTFREGDEFPKVFLTMPGRKY